MSRTPVRIGLWGGPGTGKTTFLSVLGRAASDSGWAVFGTGDKADAANTYLRLNTETLFNPADGSFPLTTTQDTALEWSFRHGSGRAAGGPRAFDLALWDVPGNWYTTRRDPAFIEHLASCRGMIYLFDPMLDQDEGDAFIGTSAVLRDLSAHLAARRPRRGTALPHFVTICVTKFDDPMFFRELRQAGWGTQDVSWPRIPRVKDQHAGSFFTWLSQRPSAAAGSAAAVRKLMTAYFAKSRISYFVTSAIGFRLLGADQSFDPSTDFINYEDLGSAKGKVFDPPNPINVLEPVLTLARNIRRMGATRWPK